MPGHVEPATPGVANAIANARLEGGDVSDETIELMNAAARGEITHEEVIEAIKRRYNVPR